MVKKLFCVFLSMGLFAACGEHEYVKPGLPSLAGTWKQVECDGKYETIYLRQDGTFDIKTDKPMATKSLDGAYELTEGGTIRFYYTTGEVYENKYDFNGRSLSLYRTKLTAFTKVPSAESEHVINVNNQIDVKPNVNVDVKCGECCNPPSVPDQEYPEYPDQEDPRQQSPRPPMPNPNPKPSPKPFPFPCGW
jgi:hypothetical protein